MKTETDPNRIKLENVRLSYPVLFTPKPSKFSPDLKFGASFILDKVKDRALILRVEKLIERVALDEFKKRISFKNYVLHDGNEKPDVDGYGDQVMFISSKADREKRPAVVDADRSQLVEGDSRPYAGCYVNGLIRVYASSEWKSVSAALLAIQFVKDGPAFGAAPVDTDEAFDDVSGGASTSAEDF